MEVRETTPIRDLSPTQASAAKRRVTAPPMAAMSDGWRTSTAQDWPFELPTLSQIRQSQSKTPLEETEKTEVVVISKLSGVKFLAAKGLDIEKLKEEVEKRGGFDKVEEKREWRQIARAMDVPPDTCAVHLRRQFLTSTTPAALRFPQPQEDGSLPELDAAGLVAAARIVRANGGNKRVRKSKRVDKNAARGMFAPGYPQEFAAMVGDGRSMQQGWPAQAAHELYAAAPPVKRRCLRTAKAQRDEDLLSTYVEGLRSAKAQRDEDLLSREEHQTYVEGLRTAKDQLDEGLLSTEEYQSQKDALLKKREERFAVVVPLLCDPLCRTAARARYALRSFVPDACTDADDRKWYEYARNYNGHENFPVVVPLLCDLSSFVPDAGTDADDRKWYEYARNYNGHENSPVLARIQAEANDNESAERANATDAADADDKYILGRIYETFPVLERIQAEADDNEGERRGHRGR